MKYIMLFCFLFGISSYVSAEEIRTGFFALDLMSGFNPSDSFSYYETAGEIKFGSDFAPQQRVMFGLRGGDKTGAVLLEYGYDFIRSEDWVPMANVSALFGVTSLDYNYNFDDGEFKERKRYLTFGVDLGLSLQKTVSKHIVMLFRTGINHELISVKNPKKLSDLAVNLYLGVGVMWYLL